MRRCPCGSEGIFVGYIEGDGRRQGTLFPVVLDDLVPADPRDLLKLYLYGSLHQIRSSRRLEAECRRNVELMWLLGRLYPDHKSIAEFRRLHSEAVTAAGAALVLSARSCGLIRGEWIA